jgi:hypothetical protein
MCRATLVGLLTALAACATEDGAQPRVRVGDPVDVNNDGEYDGIATDLNGDGIADSVDLDGDGVPDGLLPGVVLGDAGSGGDGDGDGDGDPGDGDGDPGDGDGDPGDGDGDGDGDAPPVIEIPVAEVPCGADTCAVRDGNVCCESWTGQGFGDLSECILEDACVSSGLGEEGRYSETDTLGSPRAVVSMCDGAEDCFHGQVCCYVMRGVPLSEFLGPPWVGPGAGRQCMLLADCTAEGSAGGVPTGLASCNDDDDCAMVEGTSCQPELDNTASTGKNVKARKDFKVCR